MFAILQRAGETVEALQIVEQVHQARREQFEAILTERALLQPLDVLLVGATGVGKSSTLNAIFGCAVAKVGDGVDPQTQDISAYAVNDYLRTHDSAGLGDGVEEDAIHADAIREILRRRCMKPYGAFGYIDLVLVILDGGSRDLGTAFGLLESVVLQNISPDRVVVAINQADMAMKGRHWNASHSYPEAPLADFLAQQAASVQRRIKESTGLRIQEPVCYSAYHGWNIDRLVDHIVDHIPHMRRVMA